MTDLYNLKRFLDAQKNTFQNAFHEIKNGKKVSHWMWFIFPQIAGLGFSETSKLYAIKNLDEAELYLKHPILGTRLISISNLLLEVKGKSAYQIFGSPDDMKLKSSLTLFTLIKDANPVFKQVLNQYFDGEMDEKTIRLI